MREVTVSRGGSKNQIVTGRAAGFACDGETAEFLFGNFAFPVMAAKAAKAMLHGASGCNVFCDGYGHSKKVGEGYRVMVVRLPKYTTCQVVAIAKRPNLLLGNRETAIWSYLTSPSITTPLLPEWRDYIVGELAAHSKIGMPNGFGFPVWVAKFGTEDVDKIVSEGLKKRKIRV